MNDYDATAVDNWEDPSPEEEKYIRSLEKRGKRGYESDPFTDPHEPDPTALTGQTGPWITAGFDSECSIGYCEGIVRGETIRADGQGGWECRICVITDEEFT